MWGLGLGFYGRPIRILDKGSLRDLRFWWIEGPE